MLRWIGVSLSPLFLFVFLLITHALFNITWLHIRILGGVMLIYVNYNMLFHNPQNDEDTSQSYNYKIALISIMISNISMSLESSLSLLSVVSRNGTFDMNELFLIMIGSIICVPILLVFSNLAAKLMNQFKSITYLWAGYIIYMSIQMILSDETIHIFLSSIEFTLQNHIALLISIFVVISSYLINNSKSHDASNRKKYIFLVLMSICYAILMIILIQYVTIHPSLTYIPFFSEVFTKYAISGANAIYAMCSPPYIFPTLALFISVMCIDMNKIKRGYHYLKQLSHAVWLIVVLLIIYFCICTIGLYFLFGTTHFQWNSFINLGLYMMILFNYMTIFSLIKIVTKNNSLTTLIGLLYIVVEDLFVELLIVLSGINKLSLLFPNYYMQRLFQGNLDMNFIVHCCLSNGIIIFVCMSLGFYLIYKRIGIKRKD